MLSVISKAIVILVY